MLRRFVVVEIRIGKLQEMRFYLIYSFLGFKVVDKRLMNQSLTLQTYHKLTSMGLVLNFKSFTLFSYKIT